MTKKELIDLSKEVVDWKFLGDEGLLDSVMTHWDVVKSYLNGFDHLQEGTYTPGLDVCLVKDDDKFYVEACKTNIDEMWVYSVPLEIVLEWLD